MPCLQIQGRSARLARALPGRQQSMKLFSSFLLGGALLLQTGCVIQLNGPIGDQASKAPRRVDFASPVLTHRQILLFGDIDEQAAERATQELLFLDGQSHEPIDLFLMTPGGEFKSAFTIEHMMHVIKSPVNTYALSECNSGGAVLVAAGTGKRRAFRGALIVVHGIKVHGRPPKEAVVKLQEGYTRFWRQRARLPESWLPIPPDTLHCLSAEQALQYGIVDEIIDR